MTLEQLAKYRYWYDEQGAIWEVRSFCEHPTATLERVKKYASNDEGAHDQVGGAIGCRNLQIFKPIQIEELK